MIRKIVIFSGAGLDAESGIKTFRDSDNGLWNEYKVEDVATLDDWKKDSELVLEFYNKRRQELEFVKPNLAHYTIKEMEDDFEVINFTQNVSDLLERVNVNAIHLHGELTKSRSSLDPDLIYDIKYRDINIGDKCELGSQLRPNIIWFGESLDNDILKLASMKVLEADVVIIIGTSLMVQPAASIFLQETNALVYYIDPGELNILRIPK